MTYEEAVREINAEICWRDGKPVKGDLTVLVPANTLRALLAGPPEPSVDEVARVISSNPAYLAEVRDEQQTWLAGHIAEALASRPDGWRGIESAPTDGRSVLVFCPCASDHGYERIRLTWQKDGKWQGANNTSWPPTHWMPLPPAPQPDE